MRQVLFWIAMAGWAMPVFAQQRTDADEAYRAGVAQRMQADQFPDPAVKIAASRPGVLKIRVGAGRDGACWAASGSRRVAAERAGVLAKNRSLGSWSVEAARGAPTRCLDAVLATLRNASVG
jgi:hypothetical protein